MSLQPVVAENSELGVARYHSNLSADFNAGVSNFTIYSVSQFSINQAILIGNFGNEGSEIILTHSATAPTGNTVSLASPLTKPHPKDTPVSIIAFNQIEFSWCATLTGAKSVLVLSNIDPEQNEMVYEDTTNTSGYYFTRYKNSLTALFSDYSDGIPYSGLPINTVGYAIDTAMNELHQPFTEKLTFAMMIGFTNQMLKLVRGKLKSWNRYRVNNYDLGSVSMGARRIALPTDIYDKFSNRSIKSFRIGNGLSLTPLDRDEYLRQTEDASYTEVATQAAIAAVTLVLDDTSDFDDTGSVTVYVSNVSYTIEYTANDRATNTLTVAADQITVILPVDTPVWKGLTESSPESFSVQDGYIYFWPLTTSDFNRKNIFIDYLQDVETIDSQTDIIEGVKFDMLIPYLRFRIRGVVEGNGLENLNDASYLAFRELLQDAIRNEPLNESVGFRPRRSVISGGRSSNQNR